MDADCDIAIVGVGCRFPGANNLKEYWRVLVNGENHVTDIPSERWNNADFYDKDQDAPGKIYVNKAGFLNNYDAWDNKFFGISDAEAERMDPQQRYTLECVHMALEDGGITKSSLKGSNTGVFIGAMNSDYRTLFTNHHKDQHIYTSTGMALSIIPAKVSYFYDLRGPCLALDTACSSALMAVHQGTQAILAGDCDMAICGGVNSILTPETFMALCEARMMSATGQCQAFCDTADGYARGEGCGIVILKKLEMAKHDGNKIWSTIKTGINQDGHTVQPMTAPSPLQQERLLEKIYSKFKIDPANIQYIEAHGTGTRVGDPIEVNTLGEFFTEHRQHSTYFLEPLLIGSVKTNIGHTESAAGVAGLIKALLMMKHGKMVPSLHLKKDKSNLNPEIQLDKYDMDIALEVTDWKSNENGDRLCCVNSFGYGGSNTHAVLIQSESNVGNLSHSNHSTTTPSYYVCLSAADMQSLKESLEQFKLDLTQTTDLLPSISYTSTCRRDHFPCRVCLEAKSIQELQVKCSEKNLADKNRSFSKVVFVYCGVGTEWTGMGSELMKHDQSFREAIAKVDTYIQPLTGIRLVDKLSDASTVYNEPFLNPLAIFGIQVGLTEMWRTLGVCPDAIVGQSVGEVAAAYASGALNLKNAVDVIYHRSRSLSDLSTGGTMMVVKNLAVTEVASLCNKYNRQVTIAVYNSPVACTLSGDTQSMALIKNDIKRIAVEGNVDIFLKDVEVKCAYHSHHVDKASRKIKANLQNIHRSDRSTPIVSTVTGKFAASNEFQTPAYWEKNIRQPVQFMDAVMATTEPNKKCIFIEIGPKQVLRAHMKDIFKDGEHRCLASMNYKKEVQSKHSTTCELYEEGLDICWKDQQPRQPISSIPSYVFNRVKSLFLPEGERIKFQGRQYGQSNVHQFIKSSARAGKDFKISIGQQTRYVFDHKFSGSVIVPGATYLEAVLAIGHIKLKLPVHELMASVEFVNTLSLKNRTKDEIECEVANCESGCSVTFSKGDRVLCTGDVHRESLPLRQPQDIRDIKERCKERFTRSRVYHDLKEKFNFQYGPLLSLIQQSWVSDSECLVEISLPDELFAEMSLTHIHPSIIDAVLQMFAIINQPVSSGRQTFPKGFEKVVLHGSPRQKMFGYALRVKSSGLKHYFNALLLTLGGNVICELRNCCTQEIGDERRKGKTYTLERTKLLNEGTGNEGDMETSKKDILVLCKKTAHSYFKRVLTQFNTQFLSISNDFHQSIDEKSFLETVKKLHLNAVIFSAIEIDDLNKHDPQDLFNCSKNSFMKLQELLLAFDKSSLQIPLFVVTDNTQNVPHPPQEHLNVCGAELWGMVRCSVQEFASFDICLIDINTNDCDADTLCKVVEKRYPEENEFMVRGRTVLTNRLKYREIESTITSSRRAKLSEEDMADLKSSTTGEIQKPYLQFQQNQTVDTSKIEDMICLCLTSVCLHHKEIYPVTCDEENKKLTEWPEMAEDGFQAITLEGEGKVTIVNRHRDISGETKYFLYPVNTSTFVFVPNEFTFDASELPFYMPGLLTISAILLSLSEKVPRHSLVCLLVHDSANLAIRLMKKFLVSRRDCTVQCISTMDLDKVKQESSIEGKPVSSLVILTHTGLCDIQHIIGAFPELTKIVTLNDIVTRDIIRKMNHIHQNVSISTVHADKLFKIDKLRKSLPLVRMQLSDLKQVKKDSDSSILGNQSRKGLFEIPCKSLLMSNKMNLLVRRRQLFRQNCCYIVVGGLTGLGLELMKLMSSIGAGYLVTLSRRKPSVDQQCEIERIMTESNCHIACMQTDITCLQALMDSISQIQSQFYGVKIKGVFHGAAVTADTLLVNMTEQQLDQAILPKILGSWNLHLATHHLDLDYFVMHSSIVSIIGNRGQCNYAAGNAFQDALSHYRRSRNLCSQSINWGALNVGMAKDRGLEASLHKSGFEFLPKEDISKCFLDALLSNDEQITCGLFDWAKVSETLASDSMMLQNIVPRVKKDIRQSMADSELREFDFSRYFESSDVEKHLTLQELVTNIACKIFPLPDKARITPTSDFTNMGLDSLAAMSFVSNVLDQTKCKIPLQYVLAGEATISYIAKYLFDNIQNDSAPTSEVQVWHPSLKLDTNVTFIERLAVLDNMNNPNEPTLKSVFDIEIGGTVDECLSELILKHTVSMQSSLCRYYKLDEDNNVYAEVIQQDDLYIDIEHVSFAELETDDPRHKYVFDLTKQIPIRFQIATEHDRCRLRIIVHAVFEDLSSLGFFYDDISSTMTALQCDEEKPAKRQDIDMVKVLHTKVNLRYKQLAEFWHTNLNHEIRPVTLGRNFCDFPDSTHNKIVHGRIERSLAGHIFNFVQKERITLFGFFCSIYQIFLHIETGCDKVPIVSLVDMRFHANELKNAVARCLNKVPFLAHLGPSQTVMEFIKANSENVNSVIENSIYPYELIEEEMSSETMKTQIGRHRVVMDNMTYLEENKKMNLEIKNAWHVLTCETSFCVEYNENSQTIAYQFGYNTVAVCGESRGADIRAKLLTLIEDVINNEQTQECLISQVNRKHSHGLTNDLP